MIYFKEIRWKNLLSTGNQFTEVQLNKSSTTLIVGDNGSGKSTVLDALCFGLFNKPFRRINRPQLVNSINDGGLLVEIEFDYGSKSYKVRRGVKKNIFEIYVDGKRLNQDAKVTDQQEYLEKTVLKLNYKSFTQIVLLGANHYIPFMQLKSTDRRNIIEDLLDIQIFSVMNNLLKFKISENKEDSQNIEVNRKLADGHISTTEELINDLKKTKTDQIQQNERDIGNNEEEIDRLNTTIKELMDSISGDKTAKTLEEWRRFQSGIERKMMSSEDEIEFYEKNDICLTCNQELGEEHKSKMIEEHHGLLHESGAALLKLSHKIVDLESRLVQVSKIQTAITTNQNQIQAISSYITKLKDQIEEIKEREDDIIVANWPKASEINEQLLADFENTTEVVAGIRTIRKEQNIANKEQLELLVIDNQKSKTNLDAIITKLGNLSAVNPTDKKPSGAFSFMVKANEYFIPLGDNIDVAAEIEKLQKELDYTKGFLKSVEGKMSNERFVNNAPEQVVSNEKNKMADAKSKIKVLVTKIKDLANA